MKRLLTSHPYLCLLALGLGVISTLAFDLSGLFGVAEFSLVFWVLFAVALPFRLFTFAAFFISFPTLAEKLARMPWRRNGLFRAWFLPALFLTGVIWGFLARADTLYNTPSMKRMTPDTMASFAPGYRMAEVALSGWREALYTWPIAIAAEVLALFVITGVLARFVRVLGARGWSRWAWLVPVLGAMLIAAYALALEWPLDIDFDVFIGDALLGAALNNALFLPLTLIYGGFTAPAVWVGVIAATNVWLIMVWDRARA